MVPGTFSASRGPTPRSSPRGPYSLISWLPVAMKAEALAQTPRFAVACTGRRWSELKSNLKVA